MSNLRATLLRVLLAIGLSFALWAFVSFSQNPEATVTFSDVPLEAVGIESGLVIVDANGVPTQALPSVDITLSTDEQQLARLRPVDVRAIADLTGRGAGEHIILVNVQPTRANLSFTVPDGGTQPAAVPIRLEALSGRSVPITLDVSGNLPFSFERGDPTISSGGDPIDAVNITGPQSRVERVVGALAVANIEQLRATYEASLPLVPVDAGGTAVDGVTLSPPAVTVEIPINPVVGLKLVPVEPDVVGLPAPGFAVGGVLIEPPLIALTGSSGQLDVVNELRTEPIDIGGASQTIVRSAPLIFPDRTSPRLGEPEVVRVTVQIEPIQRPFQAEIPAPVGLSGVAPGLLASVSPQVVPLTVSGTGDAILELSRAPLRASVDVAGLDPGVYQLPVSVTLPEGVSLVGDPPVVQVTLRQPPAPTATATAPAETETPAADDTATPETDTATPAPPGPTGAPEPTPTGGVTPTP